MWRWKAHLLCLIVVQFYSFICKNIDAISHDETGEIDGAFFYYGPDFPNPFSEDSEFWRNYQAKIQILDTLEKV